MLAPTSTFEQAFATRPTEPLALYSLGLYAQDEWAVGLESICRRFDRTYLLRFFGDHHPVPDFL